MPHQSSNVNYKNSTQKITRINAISGTPRMFLMEDQEAYGLRPAILLYRIRYFISENSKDLLTFKDGKWWTYDTLEEIADRLGWPIITVRKTIKRLVEAKAIEVKHLGKPCDRQGNTNLMNRVCWYTLHNSVYDWSKHGNDESRDYQKDQSPFDLKDQMEPNLKDQMPPYNNKDFNKDEREEASLQKEEISYDKKVTQIVETWDSSPNTTKGKTVLMDRTIYEAVKNLEDNDIPYQEIIRGIQRHNDDKGNPSYWYPNKVDLKVFLGAKLAKNGPASRPHVLWYLDKTYNPEKYVNKRSKKEIEEDEKLLDAKLYMEHFRKLGVLKEIKNTD